MATYAPGSKKLMIINILDILRRRSDNAHQLLVSEIVAILERDYAMVCDRKAVSRNIGNLCDAGFAIEHDRGWYLVHDFDDSELRLLIDGLLFSKHIPRTQCVKLIEKLKGLSGDYFQLSVKNIRNLPEDLPENKQLFYTIEILDEAISAGKQVAFVYNAFGTDKKLHPRRNEAGEVRRYVINPYQMVAAYGRYYLICNYDKYSRVSHYRLDLITDIELLDTPAKPMKKVEGLENGLDLPKYMAESIYMFTGQSVTVKFRAKTYIINDIIDWFGKKVKFSAVSADECDVTVRVSEEAMLCWALQYGPHVEVLEPPELRERVKTAIKEMEVKYK